MYPPVQQFDSTWPPLDRYPSHETRQSRRTALEVRRRQELDLQRQPLATRDGNRPLTGAERAGFALVALVILAAVIAASIVGAS